jgi:hypothetical protein
VHLPQSCAAVALAAGGVDFGCSATVSTGAAFFGFSGSVGFVACTFGSAAIAFCVLGSGGIGCSILAGSGAASTLFGSAAIGVAAGCGATVAAGGGGAATFADFCSQPQPTSNVIVNTAVKMTYLLILCLPLLPYNISVLIPAQNQEL